MLKKFLLFFLIFIDIFTAEQKLKIYQNQKNVMLYFTYSKKCCCCPCLPCYSSNTIKLNIDLPLNLSFQLLRTKVINLLESAQIKYSFLLHNNDLIFYLLRNKKRFIMDCKDGYIINIKEGDCIYVDNNEYPTYF